MGDKEPVSARRKTKVTVAIPPTVPRPDLQAAMYCMVLWAICIKKRSPLPCGLRVIRRLLVEACRRARC